MPPATRNTPSRRLLSNKLTRDIFNLSKDAGIINECPICLEKINCVHCVVILNCACGAKFHAKCYMQICPETVCPVCKS